MCRTTLPHSPAHAASDLEGFKDPLEEDEIGVVDLWLLGDVLDLHLWLLVLVLLFLLLLVLPSFLVVLLVLLLGLVLLVALLLLLLPVACV